MIYNFRLLLFLPVIITVFSAMDGKPACAQTRQEHVHHMAHSVMPFDVR
jgi:hypothetical protein